MNMEYRLDELFDLQMGKTPSRNNPDYWNANDHKWISISDLSRCSKYISDTKEYLSDKAVADSGISQIPANTVIMSFKLSIGKTAITAEPMYSNEAIMSFRDLHKINLLPDYIYYLLCSKDWDVGTNKAVMGKTLNKATLSQIKVKVHPYSEQKKIVQVLDKVNSIIESRKHELQYLDDLIKARFVEMFEQGKYDKVEFGSICVFLRNGANIKQTKGAGGYPITRIETLANDVFNVDRLGYADVNDLDKYHNYLLKKGDILISHINSVAYLGRAVQYRGQLDTPVIHGMNLLCARIIEGYNPTYIEFFFKTPIAKDFISTITKKAVNQASITTSDLKKMMIPAPPLSVQNEFDKFVQQVDKSKFAVQKALDEAQLLFDSLMQKYFG